jgi:hypothetical protein
MRVRTTAAGGVNGSNGSDLSYPECGHHLALVLTVYEIIVVLHRNEWREAIIDRVICSEKMDGRSNQLLTRDGR